MSAKIYTVPSAVTVPEMDFANFDHDKWEKDENNYVGECIKFGVADGEAVYMVASLRPLELIHSPMMDGYQAQNIDLMTAKRVKETIDATKRLNAYLNRVPEEAAVDKVIQDIAIDATKMSNEEIKAKCTGRVSWETPNFYIRWRDVNYLLPKYDHKLYDHEIFKFLVNDCKAHLVE